MSKPPWVLVCAALLLATVSRAQVTLPVPGAPQLPVGVPQLPLPAGSVVDATGLQQSVVSSVRVRARALLRRFPDRVERDPRGQPVMRSVIVALAPSPAAIERAAARGFMVQQDSTLEPWGERLVILLAPPGLGTGPALRELREADPPGQYDFDHLFVGSAAAAAENAQRPPAGHASGDRASNGSQGPAAIGLVDGGVDADHPVFVGNAPELLGCAGRVLPSAHGTAVASLLVGNAPSFRGAAPGARLVAVDVYCGDAEPGGRVSDIAGAMSLLAQRGVRVINLSFVGPPNLVLERVVQRVQQQGILVVAAAGNDGPNAKPLYPAAYPGVIAVTAVDARNRVLLEACRGDHIAFAAPGADMLAAESGGGYAGVRGTSYAAPLVAGLLARELGSAAGGDPARAVQRLRELADDAGRRGADRVYGQGIVAVELRTTSGALAARPAR